MRSPWRANDVKPDARQALYVPDRVARWFDCCRSRTKSVIAEPALAIESGGHVWRRTQHHFAQRVSRTLCTEILGHRVCATRHFVCVLDQRRMVPRRMRADIRPHSAEEGESDKAAEKERATKHQ